MHRRAQDCSPRDPNGDKFRVSLNNQETKLINELVEPFIEAQWAKLGLCTSGLIERGLVITMIDDQKVLRRIKVEMLTPTEPDPD
jgi:hypothetical protein